MSKAFTRDDAADDPILVPPRASLPAGAPNYVTPRGLAALRAEIADLERARSLAQGGVEGPDRSRQLSAISARLREAEERAQTGILVDPRTQPHGEVRFGAVVTARTEDGGERRYEIVGVDEAAPAHGRIAFVSPIARALLGKAIGDVAVVRTPRGEEEIEVVGVAYEDGPPRAGGSEGGGKGAR
jgi:transcription elongation factor GreB